MVGDMAGMAMLVVAYRTCGTAASVGIGESARAAYAKHERTTQNRPARGGTTLAFLNTLTICLVVLICQLFLFLFCRQWGEWGGYGEAAGREASKCVQLGRDVQQIRTGDTDGANGARGGGERGKDGNGAARLYFDPAL